MINVKDAATLAIAVVGAVLGIINLWRSISHDKAKVKVIPVHAFAVGAMDERVDFGIEVVNLGAVAVTVREVGLFHNGTGTRSVLTAPVMMDGGTLPRRLEPRTSIALYGRTDQINGRSHAIRCAYAKTDCGMTIRGNSGALKQISEALAAGRPAR
jgi:hypothetical protein